MSNKRRFRRQLDEEKAEIAHERDAAEHDLPNWPPEGGRSFGVMWWQRIYPRPSRWGHGMRGIRNEPALMILKGLGVALLLVIVGLVILALVNG
jgi:hypothetical protein